MNFPLRSSDVQGNVVMPIIKNNLDLFITKISKKQTRIPLSSLINFRKKLYSNCSETRFDIMLFSPSCVIIRGCSSEIECSFRMREVRGVQSPVPPLTNSYFILSSVNQLIPKQRLNSVICMLSYSFMCGRMCLIRQINLFVTKQACDKPTL